MIKAVQFVTLLLFALVTGVFWGTWFSLSRSMAAITPGTFLEVGRLMVTRCFDVSSLRHDPDSTVSASASDLLRSLFAATILSPRSRN